MRIANLAASAVLLINLYALAADHKPAPGNEAVRELELAEAGASGMRGIDRAYAYLLVSRDYAGLDNKSQLEAAKKSCEAAIHSEPDEENLGLRQKIEGDCLRVVLRLQPKKGEELLAQAEPQVRQFIIAARAEGAASKGDIDKAVEMLAQDISQAHAYPYAEAMKTMRALPPENSMDRDRIFAQALTYYRVKNDRFDVGLFDFGTMVEKCWQDVSPGLVLEAIDTLFDIAGSEAEAESHMEISLSSGKETAGFGSIYQYRVFQLMPVLNALDPSRAKKLSESFQQIAGLPDQLHGSGSDANGSNDKASRLSLSLAIKDGPATNAPGSAIDPVQAGLEARAEKIIAAIGSDPDAALKSALALSDKLRGMESVKAGLILRIAALTQKSSPSTSLNALSELANMIKDYPPLAQGRYLMEMGDMYLRLHEKAAATAAIERGLKQMVLLYKIDTNSDDPNRALKSSWPSTTISRAFVSLAIRVSPKLAEEAIKQAPDPDLQVFDRIELASTLLKSPTYPAVMQMKHKENNVSSLVLIIPGASE